MSQKDLLEKYEPLVIEIANVYLDNMELELGKKYQNRGHEVNAGLSEAQQAALKQKHNISNDVFAELSSQFQDMKPTEHLQKALDAFTASGGNIDIEPSYDENTQRLNVPINYVIKDRAFEKIEGLSVIEDVILKMNAMLQIEAVLSGSNSNAPPAF